MSNAKLDTAEGSNQGHLKHIAAWSHTTLRSRVSQVQMKHCTPNMLGLLRQIRGVTSGWTRGLQQLLVCQPGLSYDALDSLMFPCMWPLDGDNLHWIAESLRVS